MLEALKPIMRKVLKYVIAVRLELKIRGEYKQLDQGLERILGKEK